MAKIVLAVFGSLGDLHPMMAVGLALRARGADVTVAAQEDYRDKVLNAGLGFHPVGLSFRAFFEEAGFSPSEFVSRMAAGSSFIYKSVVGPQLARSVDHIRPLIRNNDAVVSTSLAYHADIAAKLEGRPSMVAHLSPGVMFSAYDPLLSPEVPMASGHNPIGRSYNRLVKALGTLKMRAPLSEVRQTYKKLGLRADLNLVVLKSDLLTLGLYSPLLGQKQPDHPANLCITGYPFYDSSDGSPSRIEPKLEAFLDEGPAPLVFSLGSAAVFGAEEYYRVAIKAARRMKRRAVILSGPESSLLNEDFGPDIWVADYAPHSLLFPRAAAVIHHGGIGSAGQALLSGRPQLVTPVFADQLDNANRVYRLGAGAVLPFRAWKEGKAMARMEALLASHKVLQRAIAICESIAGETGAVTAADRILAALSQA